MENNFENKALREENTELKERGRRMKWGIACTGLLACALGTGNYADSLENKRLKERAEHAESLLMDHWDDNELGRMRESYGTVVRKILRDENGYDRYLEHNEPLVCGNEDGDIGRKLERYLVVEHDVHSAEDLQRCVRDGGLVRTEGSMTHWEIEAEAKGEGR